MKHLIWEPINKYGIEIIQGITKKLKEYIVFFNQNRRLVVFDSQPLKVLLDFLHKFRSFSFFLNTSELYKS